MEQADCKNALGMDRADCQGAPEGSSWGCCSQSAAVSQGVITLPQPKPTSFKWPGGFTASGRTARGAGSKVHIEITESRSVLSL